MKIVVLNAAANNFPLHEYNRRGQFSFTSLSVGVKKRVLIQRKIDKEKTSNACEDICFRVAICRAFYRGCLRRFAFIFIFFVSPHTGSPYTYT